MKVEIRHRWNNSFLFSLECGSVKEAVEEAVRQKANLRGSNLRGSDLSGSDLRGSDLRGSDLRDSDLSGSNLRGSDLSGSDLRGSDLRGSDLRGSDLRDSDLRGSNLRGSDLRGSDLRDSDLSDSDLSGSNLSGTNLRGSKNLRLPTGETLEEYWTQTVPALLTAGGKKLEEVANEAVWKCHSWDNCPMAIAFDIHDPDKGPLLLRPRIKQFVQLYDAWQIPLEKVLSELNKK